MLDFFFPSWVRMVVGALLALASFWPIHAACSRLRFDRSSQDKGSPQSTFLSALILMIGAVIFPVMVIVLPIQWIVYDHFHLLTWRGWFASITAMSMVIFYVGLYYFYTTCL